MCASAAIWRGQAHPEIVGITMGTLDEGFPLVQRRRVQRSQGQYGGTESVGESYGRASVVLQSDHGVDE